MSRTQTNQVVAKLPGEYPYRGAADTGFVDNGFGGADVAAPEAEPNETREWEEPGFFERLFGGGQRSDTDSSGLRPGHNPGR